MHKFFSQITRALTTFSLILLLSACGASDAPGLIDDSEIIDKGQSSVAEGDSGTSVLTLSFTAPVSGLIKYTTFDITAVARSDYLPVSGEFTAVLGERYAIQVDVLGDTRIEGTERFGVRLLDEQDQIVGEIIGEIINDDFPEFFVSNPVVAERNTGQTPLVFTVSLSAEPIDDFVLQVQTRMRDGCVTGYANATQSAECAQDYIPLTTTLTFREGESLSQTITVQVLADTQVEPDEILELDVTFQDVTVTGKGIIRNDDDATQVFSEISMNPARFTETETNGCVRFEYRLRDAGTYNLNYRLVSLTKEDWESRPEDLKLADDNDFRSLQGQVVFSGEQPSSGEKPSLTVCGISIIDDKLVETNEVFAIQLFNTEGAQFYTGYIFITDNDFPDFKLGVKEQTPPSDNGRQVILQEPDSGQNVYSLLFQSDFPVTDSIRYRAYEIENEVSFGENPDVIKILPGTLNFSEDDSGGYSASIEITVLSDSLTERDELFRIGLTSANGQPLFDSSGNQQIYDVIIRDSQSDALELLYSCKDTVSEGNDQSCEITWENNIAENALPITLTHELIPCEVGDICASNHDFEDGFLNGVVIGKDQAANKEVSWTFGVKQDELVEALETATIKTSARYAKDDALVNIIKNDDSPDFEIQDADALTLSTSCVKTPPEEGAGAASGSPFTEGDTVECTITTNMVAGNVPDFDLNAALADSCAPGLVCADPDDFKEFPGSVIFAKADDVNNGIRTANWSAVIEEDALVEVAEDARVKLTFADFKVGMVRGNEHVITSYDFTVQDGNSLSLQYECKAGDGTQTPFNEGDTVSCSVSWSEDIASNALPITLTHKLLPCVDDDICASNDDFDDGFFNGVVIGETQAAGKAVNWTFGVLKDELVEAPETAKIAVLAKSNDPAWAINIATSDPVLTFTIQDGDALTLSTSCVTTPPEEGAGAASGSPFTEGDTVECTITTNDVAGNVPDFSVNVALANECSTSGSGEPAPICADLDDFKQFGKSVTFVMQSENGVDNVIRTASWSAEIKKDSHVEVTEIARFDLNVQGPVTLSGDTERTIQFDIDDANSLIIEFSDCPAFQDSAGSDPEPVEGSTVSCTAKTNPVAANVPAIALDVKLLDCSVEGEEGSSKKDCADAADFDSIPESVVFVMQSENGVDNGIRTATWTAKIETDNLVELTETARFKLSVDGPVNLAGDARKTIDFEIKDSDKLAINLIDCPSSQGATESVSEFNESDTVTCKIQTNAVAANVPAITLGVELLDCSVEGEEGSSDVVCAESADFGDDAQSGFPASLVLSAGTDGVRAETWSSTVRIDNLIEKQETANFVMTVTPLVGISVDGSSVNNLNFGFNINDGDRLVISYPPGVVDEGRTVTLTASPDIAKSVGPIEVSLSLAGCANTTDEAEACADGDDFIIDFSDPIEFNHASSSYVLNIRDDVVVEHTEKAAFKVSVSKEFSPYFKQSEQSDIQDPVVGISSFAVEDSVSEEIPMTMTGDELSGSFAFDIADNDKFEFSLSRVALEGEEYQLTAVGAYQFHSKAVTYNFDFIPAVMDSKPDESSCWNSDIHCLIEDGNKLSEVDFVGVKVTKSKVFESVTGQDIEGSGFSIPVRLTKSSPLQTQASWFTVAVDGNAPGIFPPMGINQPMLALNAETQSISVPSGSANSGAIYPAINHIYLNKSGELMVPGGDGGIIHHPDCMIDNLTGLFWITHEQQACGFIPTPSAEGVVPTFARPTITELLSLYSDPVNPIFEVLTGEIQSSSKCSADTSVYWFSPDTGAVTCSAPAQPVVVPAETPELFVIPFKEGSLQ